MGTARATPRQVALILLAFVPVVGLFAWGAVRAPSDASDAVATCLEPYYAAVDAGRYDAAWALTTAEYQRRTPLPEFSAALSKRLDERGSVVAREERIADGFAETVGETGFVVQTWFRFEHGDPVHVVYRVVEAREGWRIDGSAERTAGRTSVAGPW